MYSLLLIGPLKVGIMFGGVVLMYKNIDKLETVQRTTKLILKSDDPYDIRLKKFKRISLTDVTFLYKLLNGNINIDVSKLSAVHLGLRTRAFVTLKMEYARIDVLSRVFFHRLTDMWNQNFSLLW